MSSWESSKGNRRRRDATNLDLPDPHPRAHPPPPPQPALPQDDTPEQMLQPRELVHLPSRTKISALAIPLSSLLAFVPLLTLTSKKFTAVLLTANTNAPAPNAAVPPSVLHARFLLTTNPQRKSAVVKSSERAELQMLRTIMPHWAVVPSESEVKVMADEASAMGPTDAERSGRREGG